LHHCLLAPQEESGGVTGVLVEFRFPFAERTGYDQPFKSSSSSKGRLALGRFRMLDLAQRGHVGGDGLQQVTGFTLAP
jgi:hypothetical protein